MRNKKSSLALTVVLTISAATMILAAPRVTAQSVTVLHRFDANGVDGFGPNGSLIFDAAGNLYGTTAGGGASCGTVFELSPKAGGGWTEKILYNFGCDNQFGEDGPIGSLIFDANGNLYGATAAGGTGECYNPFNDQNELLAGCGKTHWRIGFRREIFLVPGFYSPPLVEHKTLQDCSLRIKLDEFRLAVPLPAFFGLFTGEVA
jgi:uncharacterized repeat protein (TIGR03803 family)